MKFENADQLTFESLTYILVGMLVEGLTRLASSQRQELLLEPGAPGRRCSFLLAISAAVFLTDQQHTGVELFSAIDVIVDATVDVAFRGGSDEHKAGILLSLWVLENHRE
jgi:hypothetical protein